MQAELQGLKTELSDKLTADVTKSTEKFVDAKLKNIEDKISQVKGLPDDVSADDLVKIKSDLSVIVKDFDTLQSRVKSINASSTNQSKDFNVVLSEAMKEKTDDFKKMLSNKGKDARVTLDLKDMTFSTAFSTANTSVAFVKPGIIEIPKRKLHIRELLVPGTMGNKSTFDYVKEVSGSGSIDTVAEGVEKPQIELALQEISSPAQWIAGWLRISRNMLDDVDGMTTYLQSRLPELLLRVEDDQLLFGQGVSPDLSGITDIGNFTPYDNPVGVTKSVEKLVYAVQQLESLDRDANGILLHPSDYYRILLTKDLQEGYSIPGLGVITVSNGQLYIVGVPVFKSNAMAATEFIVGDWKMGANLIIREPARVEFFYEDGVNVRENKVTVRIEERIAFPIYGDDYFIFGDFGAIS